MRRGVVSTAVALVIAICGVADALARTNAAPVQFAVGAFYNPAKSAQFGTFWGFRTSSAADVAGLGIKTLAITGPSGWNGGNPVSGCVQFNGMAPTICVGWNATATLAAGQYTAKGPAGGWFGTPIMGTHVEPPTIQKVTATKAGATVTWAPAPGALSYLVGLTPATSNTCCDTQNQAVPSSTTTLTLPAALKAGKRYVATVFAVTADLTRDTQMNVPLNIAQASASVKVGGGSPAPKAPLRFISVTVHGGASGGGGLMTIGNLYVSGVPANATVAYRCVSGCNVRGVVTGSGNVVLKPFKNLRLRVGSVAELRVTKAGYVGFYDRIVFKFVEGRFTVETKRCLTSSGAPIACSKVKK